MFAFISLTFSPLSLLIISFLSSPFCPLVVLIYLLCFVFFLCLILHLCYVFFSLLCFIFELILSSLLAPLCFVSFISGTIWANSALMNLWIVCHDGYRHASMQEDVLLGIRGTGVYCNLDHNF